jgi:hypothetical protein
MATQILSGHTGTKHMTAARQAKVNKALWGEDNIVFKVGNELDVSIEPGTGTVTVADGVFSFNGVLGVVETSDTATYVKPASDTIYAKIGVAVRYTKDSGTQVEALDIVCLKSAEVASAALALAETIDYGAGLIGSATTEAYFKICEFTANASEYANLTSCITKVDTLPVALDAIATMQPVVTALNPVLIKGDVAISDTEVVTLTVDERAEYDYIIFSVYAMGMVKIPTLALKAGTYTLNGGSRSIIISGTSTLTIKTSAGISSWIDIYGVNAP